MIRHVFPIAVISMLPWVGSLFASDSPHLGHQFQNCAACHPAQVDQYGSNSMSHALETISECEILRSNSTLSFRSGGYSYTIQRKGNQSLYSVTDGKKTLTFPLQWAFGLGETGQTYVFEKDGVYYESRVSYYKAIHGLDLTIGASNLQPENLLEAAGRNTQQKEIAQCFGCHATNAAVGPRLTLDTMTPGLQCERCHGETASHLAAVSQGAAKAIGMKKLGSLTTEEMSNFCGQCHRTWEEIAMGGPKSVGNVRFQPYRLTQSKCYDTEDKRISCVTCHDPHKPLDHVAADYDSKCTACHSRSKPSAKVCSTASRNCITCHMPKVELPGSHKRFTDHMIRIAHAGEAYPE